MSVYVMAAVWERGPQDRAQRFLLLAIADNADRNGYAFPSVRDLGKKCVYSGRQVISIIGDLAKDEWLEVLPKAIRGKQNAYQINLKKLRLEPDMGEKTSREKMSREKTSREKNRMVQVKFATPTGEICDNPPHPLLGRTVINRQEPSGEPLPVSVAGSDGKLAMIVLAHGKNRHLTETELPRYMLDLALEAVEAETKLLGISREEAMEYVYRRTERISDLHQKAGKPGFLPKFRDFMGEERMYRRPDGEWNLNGNGSAPQSNTRSTYEQVEARKRAKREAAAR